MNRKDISLVIAAFAAFAAFSGFAGAQEKLATSGPSKVLPLAHPSGGAAGSAETTNRKLPRLVDLGASKCIPCKMMAPILDG